MARHAVAYDELIAYAADELTGPRRDAIARHLAGCPACLRTVAAYQSVRAVVRADAAAAPSSSVLTRVKNLMTPVPTADQAAGSLIGAIRRVAASLIFDGRQPQAAAGLRGSIDTYALVYAAAGVDVDLQVEPPAAGSQRWLITGQVSLPSGDVAVEIEFSSPDPSTEAIRADVDETGMFSVFAEPGTYDVLVRTAGAEILLSGVRVG